MEKFLTLDLDDARMNCVADVISNKSCKKILGFLAEREATESEIADSLGMKLNTVDYNVKKLERAGLVEKSKNYFWSVRGKRMPVFRIADKKIVISPKKKNSRVLGFLSALGLTGFVALVLRNFEGATFKAEDAGVLRAESVGGAGSGAAGVMSAGGEVASGSVPFVDFFYSLAGWQWFLLGAWFAIILFLVVTLVLDLRKGGKDGKIS